MDIFEFFRRLKYAIKSIPDNIKDFIEETDFAGTINEFLNNKKNQKIFIGCSVFLFLIFILFIFNHYMTRLDGPTVKNLKINNSAYGNITYSGEIKNKEIVGQGLLTIIGDKWAIEFNGTFEDNNNIDYPKEIQIGDFKNGSIKIINLDSGNTYILSGDFEDNFLKTGYIEKTINGAIIKYTGSFTNNKLNGIGSKYIMINGESKTFEGVFIDNKLNTRNL